MDVKYTFKEVTNYLNADSEIITEYYPPLVSQDSISMHAGIEELSHDLTQRIKQY